MYPGEVCRDRQGWRSCGMEVICKVDDGGADDEVQATVMVGHGCVMLVP